MADQKISLRWPGRGYIGWHNITPVTLEVIKNKGYGKINKDNRQSNLVIEGDNAPIMKSLLAGRYCLRDKVNLMLWDPPYNTGNKDFIYADDFYLTKKAQQEWKEKSAKKLDSDNKKTGLIKDLWVTQTDASRHSKWLSFMEVRLQLAKKLLKDSGVIAIHISYHELFRLGLLMDEVFGEDNRLGIVNWECAYSPKNDKKEGISSTTDYVLIYAKNKELVFKGLMPRTKEMNSHYKSPDGDSIPWKAENLSVASGTEKYLYGIENPFTCDLHYPPPGRFWVYPKDKVKNMLLEWNIEYTLDSNGNCIVKKGEDRNNAKYVLKKGPWPKIFFGQDGLGRPAKKVRITDLKNKGRVLGTYWHALDVLDENDTQGQDCVSFSYEYSGHNAGAKKLIKAILGNTCQFDTPKPLKLTERLVEMFCPKDGLVVDAFAGSATTAHAVLNLNLNGADRRFIVIERGSEQNEFANTITAERIRRVINGKWADPKPDTKATGGGFTYIKAGNRISGKYILKSKRDDLIDVILTSHEGATSLEDAKKYKYIIGQNSKGQAIALIWNTCSDAKFGYLTMKIHKEILEEVKSLKLKKPVIIYGLVNEGPNGSNSYEFMQIPEEILAALKITNLKD